MGPTAASGRSAGGGGGLELLLFTSGIALGASLAVNWGLLRRQQRQQQKAAPSEGGPAAGAASVGGEGFEVCKPPRIRTMGPRRRTDSCVAIDEPDLDKSSLKPVMSQLENHIAAAEAEAAGKGEAAGGSQRRRKPLTVGVAGGSGSGKTTFARALFEALGPEHVTYLTHDSYYKDLSHLPPQERAQANFDHPNALDTALLVEHVRRLREGQTVAVPEYDFATHCRLPSTTTAAEPRQVIIVEGILIFSDPELVKELAIKVFIDTESDLRLIRRIHRDVKERGRSLESIVSQYVKTVRPMHLEFVETSKRFADIIIPLGMNSVALDMFLARLQQEIGDGLEEISPAVVSLARGESSQLVALGKQGSLSLS